MPGSGKTASITDWANAQGVNLVMVNAKNNDLEAYINGYTTKDPEKPRKVTQAFSDNLIALEEPNSVLFLDEYNRQVKPHIRASLYTLINEHKIVGEGPDGMHEFKNLLFTVAAINPAVATDKGAADLNDAEKSRFWWTLDDMDSDEETTIEYLTKYYNKLISRLDPKAEDYRENLEDYLRIQDLGIFIVSHPKFDYDSRDDLEDLSMTPPGWKHGSKPNLLCQRSLTQGLHNADGDVDEFKFWVENGAKFLDRDTETLVKILREYIKPSFEDLCRSHGIDPTATTAPRIDTPTSDKSKPEEAPADSSVEDDDDFFVSSDKAGTIRAKNPYEVEIAITNALKDW
jgi:predicted transcriptional regulator